MVNEIITVDKGYFTTREEAEQDVQRTGFTSREFDSPVTDKELPAHFHNDPIISYCLEGVCQNQ